MSRKRSQACAGCSTDRAPPDLLYQAAANGPTMIGSPAPSPIPHACERFGVFFENGAAATPGPATLRIFTNGGRSAADDSATDMAFSAPYYLNAAAVTSGPLDTTTGFLIFREWRAAVTPSPSIRHDGRFRYFNNCTAGLSNATSAACGSRNGPLAPAVGVP